MRIKFISLFIMLFIFLVSFTSATENFTSTWDTSATSSGSSNNTSITLPLESSGDYDFTVYWGDGNVSNVTAWDDGDRNHTYGVSGIYEINIIGKIHGFRFNNAGDKLKLINITSWGGLLLGNNGDYFYGAANLVNISADDVNLSGTTRFGGMFRGATEFNGDIAEWDVSGVTDMGSMFFSATEFNGDIAEWDVSGVTDMNRMFLGTTFNQPIGDWDVGSVTSMSHMFWGASAFNQDIGDWDVSSVTTMRNMFNSATSFNQDIGDWDVGSLTIANSLFNYATSFNQDLSGWRVCQVTNSLGYDIGTSAWESQNKPKFTHPCIRSVNSNNTKGFYSAGDVIYINVNFNENVSVSGVPKLEMEFNGGNKNASYSSGSGTTNLSFAYTIQSEDVTSDLDYVDVGSLVLDGGTINASDGGKIAVLMMPSRDTLAKNENIVVYTGKVFTSTWDTSLGSPNNQITLPLEVGGDYDFVVYWGDGTNSTVSSWNSSNASHTYSSSGIKTINIIGKIHGFNFNNTGDRLKLINITSWGGLNLGNNGGYFYGAANLKNISGDVNLSGTTDFSRVFKGASKFNGNIGDWDVSKATNMSEMFSLISSSMIFNQDISDWDVSSVTDMSNMFNGATKFNSDIGNWDVSSVTDMKYMFYFAFDFNQDISGWDVGSVTNMDSIFFDARDFNQDLSGWRVCQVTSRDSFDDSAGAWTDSSKKPKWDAPCVKSVSSDNADGTYTAGDVINITIEFNEVVSVSGIPKLVLEFDFGNGDATYVSGSGTTNLTFSYTIQEYDMVSDLDYQNTKSLKLDGSANINATDDGEGVILTLPSKNTLGASKNISVLNNAKTFTSTWEGNSVTLPLENGGNYNFTVYWGDGNVSKVTAWDSVNKTHTYEVSGNYTINIIGKLEGFRFNNLGDRNKLVNITSWGGLLLGNSGGYFYGAANLVNISADDVNLSGTTDFSNMFRGAAKFNGDVSEWDVSEVTDMSYLFKEAAAFNRDLSGWDTSKVTDMKYVFQGASVFNGNISSWNVSEVTDMSYLFKEAAAFNRDLSGWDTSKVTDMKYVFQGASVFNGNISSWNVSEVTDMSYLFKEAAAFNRDLSGWDTSKVTDMKYVFQGASVFNGNISSWDTSKVTDMEYMFQTARAFNGDIGNWDVSSVTDIHYMFYGASVFNRDIGDWDVGSVTNMGQVFNGGTVFNKDLSKWRVCQVTDRGEFAGGRYDGWVNSANQPRWSAPCVVDFSAESKTYKKGETINIRIDFNESVVVSGFPKLELDLGNASYSAGNNTSSLTFGYEVKEGDNSGDLDWVGSGALVLGVNGSINASDDGVVAVLTIPTGSKGLAGRFGVVVDWDYDDGGSADGGNGDGSGSGSTTTGGSTSGSGSGSGGGGGGGGSSSSGSSGGGGGGGSGSGGSGGSGGTAAKNETGGSDDAGKDDKDEEKIIPIGKDEPKPKPKPKPEPENNSQMIFLAIGGGFAVFVVVLILMIGFLKRKNMKRMKRGARRYG